MLTSILVGVFALCAIFAFMAPRFVALFHELGSGGHDDTALYAAMRATGSPILLAAFVLGIFGAIGFVVSTVWLIVACFRR